MKSLHPFRTEAAVRVMLVACRTTARAICNECAAGTKICVAKMAGLRSPADAAAHA